MSASSLGVFAKLPLEVRFLIWDELLPSGWQRHKADLAILRASKILHAEITFHLHKTMKVVAFFIQCCYNRDICPEYPGFEFWGTGFDGGKTSPLSPRWIISSAEDAISRGFQYLPLHVLSTAVCIEPPDPDDPGQLICLWERLQQLVRFLAKLKHPIAHLAIYLLQPDTWIRGKRKPRLGLSLPTPHPGDYRLSFVKSDVEVVLFPFFGLQNVRDASIYTSDELQDLPSPRFSTKRQWFLHLSEIILPDENPSTTARYQKLTEILNFYLQYRLDSLPGITASLLRVERFAHWAQRNYEDNILQAIKRYPVELEIEDFLFFNTMRRCSLADILRHHVLKVDRKGEVPYDPNGSSDEHVDKWFQAFPDGLLPFNYKYRVEHEWWEPFHAMALAMNCDATKQYRISNGKPDRYLSYLVQAYEELARPHCLEEHELREKLEGEFYITVSRD